VRRPLAIAAALLLVATGAASGKSSGRNCSRDLPQGEPGLPAAVVVTTDCGRFRLGTDGSLIFAGNWRSPVPPVARAYWMDLSWYGLAHGHLLIGRGMKQLWRSHDTYPAGRRLDVAELALGPHGVAFSLYRGRQSLLFTAHYGRREHHAGNGELPVAFAHTGLVTWRERGKALLLRTGHDVRFVAHAIEPQADRESRMVVFRSRGELFAFDGVRVRKLASLRKLGVIGVPVVEPLGRLVAAHDRRRLIVVDYEGRLVASTALPKSRHQTDGVTSPVAPNAAGAAVAYTVTSGNRSRETVYLLVRGAPRAQPLLVEKFVGGGCGAGAWLAWHGPWLLYANAGEQAAVVDSSGQAPALQLGDAIARLPGLNSEGMFNVEWASS
jgi:hypothetical protein